MLNKEDYKKYLVQMEEIEIAMIEIYSECISLIEDEGLKKVFSRLVEDEKRHSRLVNSLKEFFL